MFMRKLMLVSNLRYFPQIIDDLHEFCEDKREILCIPFAKSDYEATINKVNSYLKNSKFSITSIHTTQNYKEAIENAKIILVTGGNTFLLLKTLQDHNLIEILQEKINNGIPYISYSAGANILTPNIKTTNDMPIVQPQSFNALNIVPFNLNPHYFDPIEGVPGETKIQRIKEFHDLNDNIVLGLQEFSAFKIINNSMKLLGNKTVKLFEKGKEPIDLDSTFNFSKFL